MIVCHRHKFIFIKTRKTAGTSIEIALSKYCGDDDIITPISPGDEQTRAELGYRGPQHCLAPWFTYGPRDIGKLLIRRTKKLRYYNHMPAAEVRRLVGDETWSAYFKFCFERNPWDKVVSLYYFRTQPDARPSLQEFVESGEAVRASDYNAYTIDGQIAVDYLARYENMTEELEQIRARLNLPEQLVLPRAKGAYRTDKRPYRELYEPPAREWIARHFAREIEHCGYAF